MNFINNNKININNISENKSNEDISSNPLKSIFFNYLNDISTIEKEIKNEEIKKICFDSLYEINNESEYKMIYVLTKIIIYMKENRISNLIFKYNGTELVAPKLLEAFEKISSEKLLDIFKKIKNSDKFNHNEIFGIAKICAEKDPFSVAYNFKDFALTDQKQIFEIAKICAEKNPESICCWYENFTLTDEQHIYEIFKLCVEKVDNPSSFNNLFKHFHLTNQEYIYEIVKLSIEKIKDPSSIVELLKNSKLTNQQHLYETLKLCAEKNPFSISSDFKDFGLKDPQHIFEIAKICAKIRPYSFIRDFKKFELRNSSDIFEVLKLCVAKESSSVLLHLEEFGITDHTHIFEILKLSAENNPIYIASRLNKFGLKEPQLFEIIKLCALKTPSAIACNFKDCGLKDPQQIFEIVKLCANNENPYYKSFLEDQRIDTIKYFQNFGLSDPLQIFEIVQILAEKYPSSVVNGFREFGLKDPQLIMKVAKTCIKIDLELIVPVLNHFFELYYTEENEKFFPTTIELMKLYFFHQFGNFDYHEILKKVKKFKPACLNWLGKICKKLQNLSNEEKNWIFKNHFLEFFIDFRSHELRNSLTPILERMNHDIIKIFDNFLSERENKEFKLIRLALSHSLKLGINKEIIIIFTEKLSKELVNDQSKLLQIVHSLVLLNNTNQLTTLEKENIFSMFSSFKLKNKDFYYEILALRFLFTTKQEFALKNIPAHSLFTDILKNKFIDFVPIGDIENYSNKMNETFLSSRSPMAIFYYAGCLKKLNNKSIMQSLSIFVRAVLTHSFIKTRNSKSFNLHLQKLFGKNSALENKWRTCIEIQPITQSFENPETINMFEWLKTCSRHGHFGSINDYPIIQKFLNFSHEEECQNYLKKIHEQNISNLTEQLQFSVISLCKEGKKDSKIILLKEIEELLTNSTIEFKNDVKGLIRSLSRPNTVSKDLFAVETEDPYDLLLCGTEADGSCQRIDGTGDYNRGLLGYLLDGKIRLIAIKDKKNQQIVARALLRILWDGIKPVLYLECRYPRFLPDFQEQAIRNMAKKKAEQMGLELYEKSDDNTEIFLESFGGPAPYEYVDACKSNEDDGKYTIRNVRMI